MTGLGIEDLDNDSSREYKVMKAQNITLQIKSLDGVLSDFVSAAKKAQSKNKKIVPLKKNVYVASASVARDIFTLRRLKIIQALKTTKAQNIQALATLLNRDCQSIYKDVMFLSHIGLIDLQDKNKKNKGRVKLALVSNKILFEVAA